MFGTKTAVAVAICLSLSASSVWAGDRSADAADRQQAIEHSKEVHRMKQHEQEHAPDLRNQDPIERARERNRKAKEEEALEAEEKDDDLDDEAVDGTE